jgi:hypothetical protein
MQKTPIFFTGAPEQVRQAAKEFHQHLAQLGFSGLHYSETKDENGNTITKVDVLTQTEENVKTIADLVQTIVDRLPGGVVGHLAEGHLAQAFEAGGEVLSKLLHLFTKKITKYR